jgi:hypothetical protein
VSPPHEVAPTEAARQPRRPAAGEDDVSPGLVELLGDLASRLPASDNEHPPWREPLLVSVVVDVDLEQLGRERLRRRWSVRFLVRAGRKHYRVGAKLARGRLQEEASSLK